MVRLSELFTVCMQSIKYCLCLIVLYSLETAVIAKYKSSIFVCILI